MTYDEAVAEYEKHKDTGLGRLIANRELPALKAKEILSNIANEMKKTDTL